MRNRKIITGEKSANLQKITTQWLEYKLERQLENFNWKIGSRKWQKIRSHFNLQVKFRKITFFYREIGNTEIKMNLNKRIRLKGKDSARCWESEKFVFFFWKKNQNHFIRKYHIWFDRIRSSNVQMFLLKIIFRVFLYGSCFSWIESVVVNILQYYSPKSVFPSKINYKILTENCKLRAI